MMTSLKPDTSSRPSGLSVVLLATFWIYQNCTAQKIPAATSDEVCPLKLFSPECSASHVIITRSALFGRLWTGPCMERPYELGCGQDVTTQVAQVCSGHTNCSLEVRPATFESLGIGGNTRTGSRPVCSKDIKYSSFLAVNFSCVQVSTPAVEYVNGSATTAVLLGLRGFVSSRAVADMGWGLAQLPLRIQGLPGQAVRLCVVNLQVVPPFWNQPNCNKYTVVTYVEDGESQTIKMDPCAPLTNFACQGNVFSATNAVDVTLHSTSRSNTAFLLYYEIVGCADPTSPPGGWMVRTGNNATFGCTNSTTRWRNVCNGSRWQGEQHTCLEVTAASGVIVLGIGLTVACIVCVVLCYMVFISWQRNRRFLREMEKDKSETSSSIEEPAPSIERVPTRVTPVRGRPHKKADDQEFVPLQRLIPEHPEKQNNKEFAIRINENTIIKIEGDYANPRDSVPLDAEEPIYESPREVKKKVKALRKSTNASEALPNNLKVITISSDPKAVSFLSNDISVISEGQEV